MQFSDIFLYITANAIHFVYLEVVRCKIKFVTMFLKLQQKFVKLGSRPLVLH